MNCLVIGGTGFIGQALVAELLKAGHSVSVLHRRAKHSLGRRVKNIMADRTDVHAVRAALAGSKFELVFDHVYD
jgi:nucleoside-diphosphate-sugar epimerase